MQQAGTGIGRAAGRHLCCQGSGQTPYWQDSGQALVLPGQWAGTVLTGQQAGASHAIMLGRHSHLAPSNPAGPPRAGDLRGMAPASTLFTMDSSSEMRWMAACAAWATGGNRSAGLPANPADNTCFPEGHALVVRCESQVHQDLPGGPQPSFTQLDESCVTIWGGKALKSQLNTNCVTQFLQSVAQSSACKSVPLWPSFHLHWT